VDECLPQRRHRFCWKVCNFDDCDSTGRYEGSRRGGDINSHRSASSDELDSVPGTVSAAPLHNSISGSSRVGSEVECERLSTERESDMPEVVKSVGTENSEDRLGLAGADDGDGKI
jgi:hypothetical protein